MSHIREIEEHFDYAIHTDTATAFKYIKHKTSEGNINWFRVTKIETGSLTGEGFTHYIRNIYIEDVGFGIGQFICKDENGLFQIWDNFESMFSNLHKGSPYEEKALSSKDVYFIHYQGV